MSGREVPINPSYREINNSETIDWINDHANTTEINNGITDVYDNKRIIKIVLGVFSCILGFCLFVFGIVNFSLSVPLGISLTVLGIFILSYSVYCLIKSRMFGFYPNLASKIFYGFTMTSGGFVAVGLAVGLIVFIIFGAVIFLAFMNIGKSN